MPRLIRINWQQRESSGTGFLIRWRDDKGSGGGAEDGNGNGGTAGSVDSIRVVTNAHVVRNASTVRARASFGPHVVSCEVEWLSLPLDLALLRISEGDWDDFCKGWNIGDLPALPAGGVGAGAAAVNGGGGGGGDLGTAPASNNDGPASEGGAGDEPIATASDTSVGRAAAAAARKTRSAGSICLTLSAGLPRLDENVTCVGFPTGGTQISVTRG